ncbi:aminotransferase class V-fold PLP-dependent enzyme, partial [Longicatena caecimuris]|uniref:aminotransferase class V-fold PLP-dependent enzyme n=1 Tax=Longicatena caecimuris TaxID=1796635 RepID=UPI00210D3286|nr:aminotransferase class V-fold PLP-dependent enzyme [Longicatena caecimuris]
MIDAVVKYYEEYGANADRGDYDLSYFVDQEYQQTREDVAAFLHAECEEIVYTSGATAGLN